MARVYGKVTIYAIEDPETHRVFYVGRSQRPESRFLEHLAEAERYKMATEDTLSRLFGIQTEVIKHGEDGMGNAKKLKWIVSIFERQQQPEFVILDEWVAPTMQDANRLEDAWIAEMRGLGHPLTNVIYSHRMSPNWYGEKNPRFRPGWAKTPSEYISRLKAGTVGSVAKNGGFIIQDDDESNQQRAGRQMSRIQKRRIATRIAAQTSAAKKKTTKKTKTSTRSRTSTRTRTKTTRRK